MLNTNTQRIILAVMLFSVFACGNTIAKSEPKTKAVSEYDVVIFADAAVAGREPFGFFRLQPQAELSFSSHSCEPGAVLAMARDLFDREVPGYALAIRGYEYNEFGERLSRKASENLEAAVIFIEGIIRNNLFEDAAEAMKITADSLNQFGLVDEVLPEPLGAAHRDAGAMSEVIRNALLKQLHDIDQLNVDQLLEQRQQRLTGFGQYREA